jgi:hypothetical protein
MGHAPLTVEELKRAGGTGFNARVARRGARGCYRGGRSTEAVWEWPVVVR